MKAETLNAIIRMRLLQVANVGINPDALRDSICENYDNVTQEDFDNAVHDMKDAKMSELRLYNHRYVCSCGKVKNIPDRYYCADCTADWMNSLRLDA